MKHAADLGNAFSLLTESTQILSAYKGLLAWVRWVPSRFLRSNGDAPTNFGDLYTPGIHDLKTRTLELWLALLSIVF